VSEEKKRLRLSSLKIVNTSSQFSQSVPYRLLKVGPALTTNCGSSLKKFAMLLNRRYV